MTTYVVLSEHELNTIDGAGPCSAVAGFFLGGAVAMAGAAMSGANPREICAAGFSGGLATAGVCLLVPCP